MQTLCGTGHRPQDLPCGFSHKDSWKLEKLKQIEYFLLNNDVEKVISGMALGYDQWLAHSAIKVGIPCIAYVPFLGQESMWQDVHKKQYFKILEKCDQTIYVCDPGYSAWKMQKRNEKMIDDADRVLCLWNAAKRKGGTWNAVAYASSKQKPIVNIWGETPEIVDLYNP